MERNVLTKKEVAKRYKISESTINRLIKSGNLKPYRTNPPIGKVFFYEDEVLNAFKG